MREQQVQVTTPALRRERAVTLRKDCRAGCGFFHLGESDAAAAPAQDKRGVGVERVAYTEDSLKRQPPMRADAPASGWSNGQVGVRHV
jgi:hypothetical protein